MITKADFDMMHPYLSDASNFEGVAEKVIIPENKKELFEVVRFCYENKIPITISGARTGLTGSAVPLEGVILSLEKFNQILQINPKEKYVVLEPAVIISDLQNILKEYGFFYPPNPTEQNSTIGGNVATNASGAKTFKYGATRNFINRLEILLINGDELSIKRGQSIERDGYIELVTKSNNDLIIPITDINMPQIKHAAGYYLKAGMDAIDLFIGSEGTLGIVTEIELKLVELPEAVLGGLIFFDNENSMLDFVDSVRTSSLKNENINFRYVRDISARLLEFFDCNSLNLLRTKFNQIPKSAIGAIWFEQEYQSDDEDFLMSLWYEKITKYTIFADESWFAVDDQGHQRLTEFRHELPMKVFELLTQTNSLKIGTDTAIPKEFLKEYYFFMKRLLDNSGLEYYMWGHIGNSHYHANLLSKNENEYLKAKQLYLQIIDKAIELKGTISAEHGIGKLKKDFLLQMFGTESINTMKKIKLYFDEYNLLNKYNLFD